VKRYAQKLLASWVRVVPREALPSHPDIVRYEFGEPEVLWLPTPDLILTANPQWVLDNLALWKESWPRPFVCAVSRARLLGRLFLGVTAAGEVILETTRTAGSNDLLWPKVTRQTLLNYLSTFGKPTSAFADGFWAPLFHVSQESYFHWFCDVLPIVEAVRAIESVIGAHVRFIVSRPLSGWQQQTLALAGVDLQDVVHWNGRSAYVPRLVVASVRTDGWTCLPSIAALRWIREQAIGRTLAGAASPPLIYIRRVGRRRVANDAAVTRVMESRGIVSVELESMTAVDQVRLFRGARLIVGSHGAGLTNMVFSDDAEIIELFGPWKSLCYAAIARGFGHRYVGLDMMPSIGFQRHASSRRLDFTADVDMLASVLDERLTKMGRNGD
jgi:hypothetical protein